MTRLRDLPTPALLLDLDVLEANVLSMARRAERLGVRLRPHVKTHKCVEVARLQRDAGALGITVSTLEEARVFADHGFDDMTWAFPVIPGRIGEAREVDRRARLRLLVDHRRAVKELERAGHPFHAWLEVDPGYGRSGVDPGGDALLEIGGALAASEVLAFDGLLSHSGQAYGARSPEELAAAAEEERSVMVGAARRLLEAGVEVPALSVGSTPAMSRAEDLTGVDEARPGNYVLYDRTQMALGACAAGDVAATVLATVVSSRPAEGRSVVDAGALALSKDPGPAPASDGGAGREGGPDGEDARDDGGGSSAAGTAHMGALFEGLSSRRLRDDARLVSLSQEHGLVDRALRWGDKVRILPNHACLTVACFDAFHVVRGEEVLDRWTVHRER